MSYRIETQGLLGEDVAVEIGPGPGAPSVKRVVVEEWTRGTERKVLLLFELPLSAFPFESDQPVEVEIVVDILGSRPRQRTSGGLTIDRGAPHVVPVEVRTHWPVDASISDVNASIVFK